MNKAQLLELLGQTWPSSQEPQRAFLTDLASNELKVWQLIKALEKPEFKLTTYHHPEVDQPLALIQKSSPRDILLSVFNAWGQDFIPLILDPTLPADQTKNLLGPWGLKTSKPILGQINEASTPQTLELAMATSGSSGRQKLIGLAAQQLMESTQMARTFFAPNFPRSWGLTLPCWHIGGFMILWRMLVSAGQVHEIDLKTQDPGPAWDHIQGISLVPTQLQRLIDQGWAKQLAQLSLVLLGGAACPKNLRQKASELGLPLSLSYGATETSSLVAATPLKADPKIDWLTPLSGVTFQLGAEQKLQLSSPSLHSWRIENQQLTRQSVLDFYQTQDRAELSPTGELKILGRADHTFISGGENVSAEKIERVALEHPLVQQATLLHRSDPEYGQVGHLFYQPAPRAQIDIESQLTEHLKKKLRGFERPKSLQLMPKYSSLKPPRQQWQKQIEQQSQTFKTHPSILLLHGFMGLADEFFDMKQALLKRGLPAWKIKAPALPGHGGPALNIPCPIDEAYQKFEKMLGPEIRGPHIFYAYSMGARILSTWLDQQMEGPSPSFKGMLIESGHPGGLDPDQAKKRALQDAQIFDPKTVDLKAFIRQWSQLPLFEGLSQTPRAQELIQIKSVRHDPHQLYQALQAFSVSHQPNVQKTWHSLAKSRPVFYLSGEKDQKYTKIAKDVVLGSAIQHAHHPTASHNIHLLDPDWCAEQVLQTLSRAKGSSFS